MNIQTIIKIIYRHQVCVFKNISLILHLHHFKTLSFSTFSTTTFNIIVVLDVLVDASRFDLPV